MSDNYPRRKIGAGPTGVLPALLFLTIVFFAPVLLFTMRSFFDTTLTFEYYSRSLRPIYLLVLLNTFKLAAAVTSAAVIIGFPFAYGIYRARTRTIRLLLLAIALLPFWTNLLIRTFALMILLQREGVVNTLLRKLHIIHSSLPLIYNFAGVVIAMTYMLLPYFILPVSVVLEQLDPLWEQSALTLGASRRKVFQTIVVPLSMPGVLAGIAVVFLMSLGFFVTPALVGGGREQTISMVIVSQVNDLLNWNLAAALSVLLIAAVAISSLLVAVGALLSRHFVPLAERVKYGA